ncbi:type II toxin-antitoxin system HipA family toxin [Desulfomicrobium sp. ZS1]|uniref:type II toxin-antitoxin system HipA family toxin n=1 Tax=Desulfomicrobium sp. ZS1 TaxID=2952228 RepID=UPI0020B2317C|nr:type II toxin-antitoxin system HipA family toxin [Desulfomicrobium sp. ZS1]UTF49307.1 type II toxin-antitoxin system HipA family toxin [Desulfomicrobium sp. ZS1]
MNLDVHLHAHGERRYMGKLAEQGGTILFQYAPEFLDSGINISPFKLPLSPEVKEDPKRTFDGLFGVFNDSLPDGWGLLLLDRALRKKGTSLHACLPLQRLAMVGTHGMGALEYTPANDRADEVVSVTELDALAEESLKVLRDAPVDANQLDRLIQLNGSSAGARPKILVNVADDYCIAPQGADGEPWIIKFRSAHESPDTGLMEYTYSIAAREAGLDMPETHLFPSETTPGYFGVKRFDRMQGMKVHVHTACGLLHASHREPSLTYESLLRLTLLLTKDMREVQKMVRLMVFNVRSGNKDDHSKNFSFLLDKDNQWRMAPVYDLNPSEGINGEQTCMVNNKGLNITEKDLQAAAATVDVDARTVREMIQQVDEALAKAKK